MGKMAMLALLSKLPWKVIGPIVVVAALALCVRERVIANARADAYTRIAQMTSKYALQQEQARVKMKQAHADSIKLLHAALARSEAKQAVDMQVGREAEARLRATLTLTQRALLDSTTSRYRSVIVNLQGDKNGLQHELNLVTQDLHDAEASNRNLALANESIRKQCASKPGGSSTVWKVVAGVAAATAVIAVARH